MKCSKCKETECKHEKVVYCEKCHAVECADCGKKWGEASSGIVYIPYTDPQPYYPPSYPEYPQWTYTGNTCGVLEIKDSSGYCDAVSIN